MIIDGRKISEKILNRIEKEIKEKKLKLKLVVILVGDDPQSKIYVKKKGEACKKIGVDFELYQFPKNINEEDLAKKIQELAEDKEITGIVVQLPLPKQIDTDKILNMVSQKKDIEGFISENESPIVSAVKYVLEEYGISLENKKIALIGKGRLVGTPVGNWLKDNNLIFSDETEDADIIISGVGKRNLINKEMVKEGVIIIDIGGDVASEVESKAKLFTPIIGGVGPVTVACLLENLVKNGSRNI